MIEGETWRDVIAATAKSATLRRRTIITITTQSSIDGELGVGRVSKLRVFLD